MSTRNDTADPGPPAARGLYDPALEKDSCGVGFIADIKGRKSHQIVEDALTILVQSRASRRGRRRSARRRRRRHSRADPAQVLRARREGSWLYAAGARRLCGRPVVHADRRRLAARDHPRHLCGGSSARRHDAARLARCAVRQLDARRYRGSRPSPCTMQVFIGRARRRSRARTTSSAASTFCARRSRACSISAATRRLSGYYPVSLSCRTVVYKGMFLADQLGAYYPDLHDAGFRQRARAGASALLDQHVPDLVARASLPDDRAQRRDQHAARQQQLDGGAARRRCHRRSSATTSTSCGRSPTKASPDTACFDNALEFLVQGGYSLAHAMMMMVPEAWAGNPLMDEERRAFYEYNAALMEPWDGPGRDRLHRRPPDWRHARPQRPASGALHRHPRRPHHHGVGDGRAADPGKGHRHQVAPAAGQDAARRSRAKAASFPTRSSRRRSPKSHPYKEWLEAHADRAGRASGRRPTTRRLSNLPLLDRQQAFGYTQEDLKLS